MHTHLHPSGNMDMDPRDIATVRNSISYVEKFARHNKGDMDAALHHMVSCSNIHPIRLFTRLHSVKILHC